MDSVYKGMGGTEGGLFHILVQKSSYCMFIQGREQPQFTSQANTVTENSLIPSVALLVSPHTVAPYTP